MIKKAGCEDLIFDIEENKLFLKAENKDRVSINIPFSSHEKNSVLKSELKYENEILKIFSISQPEFNFHEEGNFIDEKFPQYEKILPSTFKATAKLKTSELKKF